MTEEQIIRGLASAGALQAKALRAFYDLYAQAILRWLVHQGASSDEAEDVFQETMIRVVAGSPCFSGAGAARSWVWQITRNCLIDYQRKKGRRDLREVAVNDERWAVISETIEGPTCGMSPGHVDDCVEKGLLIFRGNEPNRFMALTLQMEGASIDEIGRQINRTTAATKTYLSECRKKLKPYIGHCLELLTH